jgi:AcrR family transcriptional regulator
MPRARKSGSATAHKSPGPSDPQARLIEAALELAGQRGWRNLGVGEIARKAGVPLAEAYRLCPSKPALLAALIRQINAQTLTGSAADGSPREKLFELMMRRFDALKSHRAALKSITRDTFGDPTALCTAMPFLNGLAWVLEAAGLSAAGWRGPGRVLALAGIYAQVMRTFLDDDSDDLGKTMAALDRRLKSRAFGTPDEGKAAAG